MAETSAIQNAIAALLELLDRVAPPVAKIYRELLQDMLQLRAASKLAKPGDMLALRRIAKQRAELDARFAALEVAVQSALLLPKLPAEDN